MGINGKRSRAYGWQHDDCGLLTMWNILSRRELVVPLPRTLNKDTIYPLVDSVLDENYDAKCGRICFDFSTLKFIEPAGVTVLSNLIEFLRRAKVRTQFRNHTTNSPPIRYLDDSGFFKQYLQKSLAENAVVRSTTLPLNLVEYSHSFEYLEFALSPWLSVALSTSEKSLATAKVCFQEIFNNINDHSTENIGCSFAQHYPNKDVILISISDFGVGIPLNVKKREPGLNDQQAIARACEPGFTTQTTTRNRGAGLDVLITNVVSRNGGAVMIHSRRGIVACTRDGSTVKKISRGASGFYPGTLIQIALHTNTFVSDEVDEEFEW